MRNFCLIYFAISHVLGVSGIWLKKINVVFNHQFSFDLTHYVGQRLMLDIKFHVLTTSRSYSTFQGSAYSVARMRELYCLFCTGSFYFAFVTYLLQHMVVQHIQLLSHFCTPTVTHLAQVYSIPCKHQAHCLGKCFCKQQKYRHYTLPETTFSTVEVGSRSPK